VLFAMMVFSSFISGVTNTVNAMRQLTAERSKNDHLIKLFIVDHAINVDLGRQIKRFADSYYSRRKRRVIEQDIDILADLPPSLRSEVRQACFSIYFESLSPFSVFGKYDDKACSTICDAAMSEKTYYDRSEIFVANTRAANVYFLLTGNGTYQQMQLKPDELAGCKAGFLHRLATIAPEKAVGEKVWLAELAFWVNLWLHRGSLIAQGTIQCVLFDYQVLQKLLATRTYEYQRCLTMFAAHRCRMIEIACGASEEPTDLSNDELKWESLGEHLSSQTAVCRRISELVHDKSMEGWKIAATRNTQTDEQSVALTASLRSKLATDGSLKTQLELM